MNQMYGYQKKHMNLDQDLKIKKYKNQKCVFNLLYLKNKVF